MRDHHEVELMYAPSVFGLFQPRLNPYSRFGNVVLRVVPPRPRIEDLILQLLTSDETHNDDNNALVEPTQKLSQESFSSENTPDDDISERMAREMQAEEDREQEMRDRAVALGSQFGGLLSSFFGTSREDSVRPTFYQQPINAEAGPSTIRTPKAEFSSGVGRGRLNNVDSFSMMAEEEEAMIVDESNVRAGKKRAEASSILNLASHSSPMELLDNIEAALRHEVNKFNFPERLDFLNSLSRDALTPGTPPSPVLSHTSDNMSVRAHEQALSDLLANMDALANDEDEDVRMRQLQLGSKIRRELEELDRKVLEAWAASRRYTRS